MQAIARAADSGADLGHAFVRASFERICTIATIAVANWMSGGSPEDGRDAGREAWQLFGELAAQRAAPLHEITKRCLFWRDSADTVLRDSARQLEISHEVLAQARMLLQITLDVTLVKMCEVFESERQRTDEELERRQEELVFMATHDPLTGLPNRTLILDRGQQMVVRSRRHQNPVAALAINLDNFKGINDSLGHQVGDEILQAVTRRFDGVLRGSDGLARVGGDEFVVIADDLSLAGGPDLIAARLLEAMKEPFRTGETTLTVNASIGIATGPRGSVEELLRDANTAMYRAKWDGKNRFVMFESSMQDAALGQMELEMDLREALRKDEFFLVYQPTFDLRDMHPKGMEALIRWRHPTRGVVAPGDFIPLLEETGMVNEIGLWVLQQACRQGARWRQQGHDIGVAVNVSARQLDTDDLLEQVSSTLADSDLEPNALTLEITETALMRNVEETARRLARDQAAGRAHRDRRLRHRLLIARAPAAVPGRLPEDRPLVHRTADRQPRGRDADAHARAARQGAVDRDARRGNRAGARAVAAARGALRQRPGLPVRTTTSSRLRRRVPARVASGRQPRFCHVLSIRPTGASAWQSRKRMKGFEPSTFAMARRRSSQLSYIRASASF